jgi:hypothetical protein
MALRERERGRDRDDDRGGRGRDRDEPRGRDRDAPRRDRDRDEPRGRGGATRRADITYNHHKQENVKRRAEQTGGNFDLPFKSGVKTWKAKVGENAIRIMPPTWADASHYGYDVWLHSFIGSSGSTYICPKKTFNKPCAACDEAAALKAAGEDEEAKEIAVKQKVLYYIIDRDDRKPVPQILVASWNQDKEISEASKINRTNKTLYIDHADEGYDVIVKRTGQKLNTRYQWLIDRESSPLDPDSRTQDELLEFIAENPIPSLLKYDDNEKIAAALAGTTREKDKDLDDRDDRGSRGRGRDRDEPRGRGRDAEDDEAPRGRGRGRDEEDEEDTVSPRGRRLRGDADDEPRGRGRDPDPRDEEEEERPRRGGRDRDEEDERPRGRARDEEDEPRRGRDRDAEEEDDAPRGRGRDRDADDRDDGRRRR